VQSIQGNLSAALDSYKASLALRERLAESDPTNTEWQRNVSIAQESIGDVLREQGNLAAALSSYEAPTPSQTASSRPILTMPSGSAISLRRTKRSAASIAPWAIRVRLWRPIRSAGYYQASCGG